MPSTTVKEVMSLPNHAPQALVKNTMKVGPQPGLPRKQCLKNKKKKKATQ